MHEPYRADLLTVEPAKSTTSRGIFWMFITGLCFLSVTVSVRYIGPRIPAAESAFIRYLVGTLILIPVYYRIYSGTLRFDASAMMGVRGVAHGLGVILWFFAMARIPIAQVTALGFLTPVVITLAAAIFLREKLHARRLTAVVVGFIGMLVIVRPGFNEISIGQIAQIMTTPLFALSMILAKKLTEDSDPLAIVAGLSFICTLTLLVPALLNWVSPTLLELLLLSVTAVFATLGHYTMTLAFKCAPLSVLQPISFLQLLWASVAGVVLFAEALDFYVVLGGAILVFSASYITYRESQIERQIQ